MSKHRELAQVVYAKTLGRESASRIWRTVVVAGAMLASPMIASANDSAPPPAKTEKAPSAPVQSKPAPPAPTKAELAQAARDILKSIDAEIAALDPKIKAATTDVTSAQNQADRDLASAKLKSLKTQKTELKSKQTKAKADVKKADAAVKAEANANKPKPRPRANEELRPKGRGFILS